LIDHHVIVGQLSRSSTYLPRVDKLQDVDAPVKGGA
jgi:hypothetical protein